ncbi:MAG: insulinase family protein [Rhodospirillaceae bacterium]|nr:insulinase family protein [Rhodospirillaceae bacterium]
MRRTGLRLAALLLASSMLAPTGFAADAPKLAERDGVWAQTYSDIKADPAVRFGQMKNGMRYAVMHNETPKNQVSIRLVVTTGSIAETESQLGLAHFLEHMAFKGSKKVPANETIKILQRLGLSFGGDTNASTNMDITDYRYDLPKADAESIDTGLMLTRETVSELTLDQGEMDKERGVVLSEERARDSPGLRAYIAQLKFLMPGQRAADRLPIGSTEILKNAPVSEIAAYYRAHYRPERTTLVVVGDVDVDQIEGKIKTLFEGWTNPTPAPKPIDLGTPAPGRKSEALVLVEPGASFEIDLDWMSAYDNAADTTAVRRRDAVRGVAIGILNRRLARVAQQPNPPFQRASASRGSAMRSGEIAEISISATPETWEKALMAAENLRRQAVEFGVHQNEVDEALTEGRTARETAVAGAAARRSPALAGALERAAANNNVFTSPAQSLEMFNANLKDLKAAEVNAVLKEIFTGNGPLVFVSTPKPIAGGEAAVMAALSRAQAAPVTPAVAEAEKVWPYTTFGTPGKETGRKQVADLGVTFVTFSNGVHLTVKPTDYTKDQILVNVRIGQGIKALPADQFPALWATGAFTSGGLKDLNQDELRRVFAGKVVSASLGFGEETVEIGGATRAADLDLQMQLMTAYMTAPGYRSEAFERLRTGYKTRLEQVSSTPGAVYGHNIGQLIHSGDLRWHRPDKAEADATTLAQVRDLIQKQLDTGRIEVVIAGDVTVDQAVAAVAGTLGALPPRAKEPAIPAKDLAVKFPGPKSSPAPLTHTGRADQAIAMIAWRTDDFFKDPQRARATRILEQIMRLRLTEQFRIAEGNTYSASTDFDASETFPGYGYLAGRVETPPAKIDQFFAEAQKIADDIRKNGVSADELERARKPRVEALTRAKETNGYWLSLLGGAQEDARKLDAIRESISGIEKVTAADVKKSAEMYLTEDRAWKLRVLPEKGTTTGN